MVFPSWIQMAYLTISMIFGAFLYEYFYAKATVTFGPVATNVCLALVIPLSMATDAIAEGRSFTWYYYVATAGLLVAIVCMNLIELTEEKAKSELENLSKAGSLVSDSESALTSDMEKIN